MGFMSHHAIIVTGCTVSLPTAHKKAKKIFNDVGCIRLVSNIITSPCNDYKSFFIAPDGSKEGWDTSELYDQKREKFISWLKQENSYDWALIQYGNDADENIMLDWDGKD